VIASALYAQGRSLISRSFKYHRPRGVLTMAGQDANTLVQVGAEPNVRDQHFVAEGGVQSIIAGSARLRLFAVMGCSAAFCRELPKTSSRRAGVVAPVRAPIRIMAGPAR
jgi:sarcosine oxidase subunit alpha